MYDGVRGLFLPVLLPEHLEALLVPGEGVKHPKICCELLAWCGSGPVLKAGACSSIE